MDLKEYEQAKFELASILRSAEQILQAEQPGVLLPFRDLFARLADDLFNLVVVGRFNRGKTSLMNAMLTTDRLPTGIVPLTSVITTVAYGSSERVTIEYSARRLPTTIRLDELPDYVTQRGNPGNARGVSVARVQLPSEILRRGFHFVDTPGLGSSILENTRTTEAFLPEADALMLVTSYDSPLSEEELRLLREMASSACRVFLVVNKHDAVSVDERNEVLCHIRDQSAGVFGTVPPQIFSVSARQALDANQSGDRALWVESGLPDLEEQLTRFLVEDKQSEFLFRMCERVADSLQGLPDAMAEIERVQSLRQGLIIHRPSLAGAVEATSTGLAVPVARGSTRFSSCEICRRIDRDVYDFLRKFQSDLVVHPALRACFADHGGLCASHTWLYQSMASSRGTCIGFPEVLDRLAARLRDIAAEPGSDPFADEIGRVIADPENCEVCQVRMKTERAVVADLARRLGSKIETFSAVCLPHLRLLAESVENRETVVQLLIAQAEALDRVSEDMRRYVLRIDGTRRFLITQEEEGAGLRGLMLLAGHRNVGSTWTSAIDNSDGGSHSKRYR